MITVQFRYHYGDDYMIFFCLIELYDICELLGIEQKWLYRALTSRNIDDVIIADLSAAEASNIRDSLCKALYSRLFTWLVSRINDAMKVIAASFDSVCGCLNLIIFPVEASREEESFGHFRYVRVRDI